MGDRQGLKSILKTGLLLLCLAGIGVTGSGVKAEEGDVYVVREASGDLESLEAIEISDESMEELEEWSEAHSSQNAQYNVEPDVSEFLEYGSRYGYNDMTRRSNSAARQEAYLQMAELCKNVSVDGRDATTTTVNGRAYAVVGSVKPKNGNLTSKEMSQVYFTFRHDNPQFFWLSNSVIYGSQGITVVTYDEYKSGAARKAALEQIIETTKTVYKSAVRPADTDYTKIKTIHDTLISEIDYQAITTTPTAHSIAGAMIDNLAVCEGYAKVMQVMMNCYGINNIYVTGIGYTSAGSGGHAWNMVGMNDNKYYWLDATWDDQTYEQYQHQYFLVGNKNFTDHKIDTPNPPTEDDDFLYALPEASDEDYDPSANPPVDPPVNPYSKGDISGDGHVDIFDLMMCLNHVAGKTQLEGDAFKAANVVDTDDVVNLYDLMRLLNHIAKGIAF